MTFASNPGFLAVAFIEGSAACILLVLYWLLLPSFPARFFRYWLAGWTVYTALEGLRIFSLWRDGRNEPQFGSALSLVAAALFFAAILECREPGESLMYLWSLGFIAASGLIALGWVAKLPNVERWEISAIDLYRWVEENRPELAARVVFTASDTGHAPPGAFPEFRRPILAKPFPIETFSRSVQNVLATVPSPKS